MTDRRKAAESLLHFWEEAGVSPLPAAPVSAPPPQQPKTASQPARDATPLQSAQTAPPKAADPEVTPERARALAAKANNLDDLFAAMMGFDAGPVSHNARQAVISRGNPKARIMLVGEAPGRDEDMQGAPFVGRAGQLLDRMLAAIDLDEDRVFITNVFYWRPPGNRTPEDAEIAMVLPFLERMIALIQPKVIITAGNSPTKTLLNTTTGITRMRGRWDEYAVRDQEGQATDQMIPLLPMFHPAFLLRRPINKREAWADLQSLAERMREFS